MKPRPRRKMSNSPVYIGLAIFALLVVSLWYLSKGSFSTGSKASPLCGYAILESMTLTEDVFCPADSLGLLPGNSPRPFVFVIQTDSVVFDGAGHKIQSDGGYGVVLEDAGDVTIRNCDFSGQDIAVSASGTIGLTVEKIKTASQIGGIEILNGQKSNILDSTLSATGEDPRWGVQFVGGSNNRIEGSFISGFLYSGINFYGTQNFVAEGNTIKKVRDTGIGFFQKSGYPPTRDGSIKGNSFEGIKNVGAFEVMHGTQNLSITKNQITNCKSALYIYEKGIHGPIGNIFFGDNQVDACNFPFNLTDCENISIQGNEIKRSSGGGLVTMKNAINLRFDENLFFLNNGPFVIAANVNHVTLFENRFQKHFGQFLRVDQRPETMNLEKNSWDGRPAADRFKGIKFPDDINPVMIIDEGGKHYDSLAASDE